MRASSASERKHQAEALTGSDGGARHSQRARLLGEGIAEDDDDCGCAFVSAEEGQLGAMAFWWTATRVSEQTKDFRWVSRRPSAGPHRGSSSPSTAT